MSQGRRTTRPTNEGRQATPSTRPAPLGLLLTGSSALLLLAASAGLSSVPAKKRSRPAAPAPAVAIGGFLRQSCFACHSKSSASGGLDLTSQALRPDDPASFNTWVKVYDRVTAGEMPPKQAAQPAEATRKSFLAALRKPLLAADDERVRREGRTTWRRMNRYEYENSLRDLLDAPWLQVKEMLPEDGLVARFNKVGDALDVSHVQMSRYLSAAGYALHAALGSAPRPQTTTDRYYARAMRSFANAAKFSVFNKASERATFPILGNATDLPALKGEAPMTVGAKDPARREQETMGVVASAYEPLQPKFDRFRAPVSGHYKLRLRAHSFWAGPEDAKRWWKPDREKVSAGRTQEPVSLYASMPPLTLRKLGTVDVGPESSTSEIDVILLKGETIQPDAARLFRSRPPNWHNPLATPEGQPGVAYHWLEVEGPIYDTWPTRGQQVIAGGLPLKADSAGHVEIVPNEPDRDGERLVRGFMQQAIRHPVTDVEIAPFVKLFHTAQAAGASFTEAVLTADTGVLCSPDFVTLEERPGPLEDHALATRLSYFLWNSEPDATLRALADRGALHNPKVLSALVVRLFVVLCS